MKDTKNTLINLTSFGVTSFLGLYLYFLLVKNGNEEVLGIFNIQYIFIILLSQLSTFGFHYSVLREATIKNCTKNDNFNNLFSAILLIFVNSIILCFLIFVFRNIWRTIVEFNPVNILIPIILFSINKAFYWFLNGKEKYLKMAFISPVRFFIYLIVFLNLSNGYDSYENLYLCFLYSEIVVLFLSLIFIQSETNFNFSYSGYKSYLKKHISYGKKSFLTSFLSDLNLKIDIIVISVILGNQFVGYYTFSSAIGEGFIALIAATRTISTPQFENFIYSRNDFQKFLRRIRKISYSLFIPIGISIISISYFFGNQFKFLGNLTSNGFFSLVVIISGFTMISYLFSFEHVLLQINHPTVHTKCLLILFFSNLILNIFLVNSYGINGAAFATIFSYFFYFYQINKNLKKITGNSFIT